MSHEHDVHDPTPKHRADEDDWIARLDATLAVYEAELDAEKQAQARL